MKKIVKIATLATVVNLGMTTGFSAAEMNGKLLFEANCMSCHNLTMPADRSTMVAPLAKAVVFHLGETFGAKEAMKKHINDFVLAPSKEKAICRSIRRFGLMPSMKGVVTKEQLEKIATWMVDNLSMTDVEHAAIQQTNRREEAKNRSAIIFKRIDTNHDGLISQEEFTAAMGEGPDQYTHGKKCGKDKEDCGGDCDKR